MIVNQWLSLAVRTKASISLLIMDRRVAGERKTLAAEYFAAARAVVGFMAAGEGTPFAE